MLLPQALWPRPQPALTLHRRPLGENGDGALGHLLLLDHWGDFGAPAVRAHPQEVTRQVVAIGCSQNSPGKVRGQSAKERHTPPNTRVCLPDVVLVSEQHHGAGSGRLQQPQHHLVKLSWSWFSGNLQGLSDANAAWRKQTRWGHMIRK